MTQKAIEIDREMVQAAYDQDQMDPEEEAYMMQQQMAMQQQQEMYQDEYGQEMMH